MADRYDFTVDKGSTHNFTILYKEKDTDTPIDLTSYTGRMQVRENIDDDNVILELTTENGGIVLGGAAGTAVVSIAAATSSAILVDSAVYDLELVNGDFVVRLIEGNITFTKETTR